MINQERQQIDHYLNAMGIVQWLERDASDADVALQQPETIEKSPWQALEKAVSSCQQCPLAKSRTNTVFGTGSYEADLMIIGEAPGANEDKQGKPFVGRAGQLLTAMLQAIGLERNSVFIGNVLKCRPPQNRDPSAQEVAQCTPYLEQQIALLQPKIILAVGRVAAHYLLGVSTPLSRLRGQRLQYGESKTPLLVTYHPAYLLRNPRDKNKAYQDLLLVNRFLGENSE